MARNQITIQSNQVPPALTEMLKFREDEEGHQRIALREPHTGHRVRMAEKVMAGYEAIFEAKTDRKRVWVLLKIANTTTRVQVRSHDIEPADLR